MNYNISLTNDSLTVVFTGGPSGVRVHTINSTHPSWANVLALINDPNAGREIETLMSVKETIVKFSHGRITVSDNAVLYDGKPVGGFVVDRILEFAKKNLPYQPLVRFLEKVRKNPSARSVEELYRFLEHRKMPLTPDGNFLAYKSVRSNYTDHYTGTVLNSVGSVPKRFERNQVDDDANRGCSFGYHAGSYEYATGFNNSPDRHLMIVEVDPADVVCVPNDSDCQKLRCVGYKVVGEFTAVLNDEVCDDYGDDEVDESDDESDDEVDDFDPYNGGYENGYDDGQESYGFNNTIVVERSGVVEFVRVGNNQPVVVSADTAVYVDIAENPSLYESYKDGYQIGYDEGVQSRV